MIKGSTLSAAQFSCHCLWSRGIAIKEHMYHYQRFILIYLFIFKNIGFILELRVARRVSTISKIMASSYVIETLWVSGRYCIREDFWNCGAFSSLHFKESLLTRKSFLSESTWISKQKFILLAWSGSYFLIQLFSETFLPSQCYFGFQNIFSFESNSDGWLTDNGYFLICCIIFDRFFW